MAISFYISSEIFDDANFVFNFIWNQNVALRYVGEKHKVAKVRIVFTVNNSQQLPSMMSQMNK